MNYEILQYPNLNLTQTEDFNFLQEDLAVVQPFFDAFGNGTTLGEQAYVAVLTGEDSEYIGYALFAIAEFSSWGDIISFCFGGKKEPFQWGRLYCEGSEPISGTCLWIDYICTANDKMNSGYGAAQIEALCDFASHCDLDAVLGETLYYGSEGQSGKIQYFYDKLGFFPIGEVPTEDHSIEPFKIIAKNIN